MREIVSTHAQQDIGTIPITSVKNVTILVWLVTDSLIKIVFYVKTEKDGFMKPLVLTHAQKVITEMNLQHVNHVQIIV